MAPTNTGEMAARMLTVAAAAVAVLALPAPALAKRGDRNHDRIPDRWERHFGIALTKKAAAGDPDHDGLSNRGEFLAHTSPKAADTDRDGVSDANEDPDRDRVDNGNEVREHTNPLKADTNRNRRKDGLEDAEHDGLDNADEDASGDDPIDPDTDDDGVKDGKENGGWIASFDGASLTVGLFRGGAVSGLVDESTEIRCGSEDDFIGASDTPETGDDSVERTVAADDLPGDDPGADGSTDDPGADDSADDGRALDGGGDGPGDGPSPCSTDDLKVGSVVHEADLSVTGAGAVFSLVELVDSSE